MFSVFNKKIKIFQKPYVSTFPPQHTCGFPQDTEGLSGTEIRRIIIILRKIGVEDHIPAIIQIIERELSTQKQKIENLRMKKYVDMTEEEQNKTNDLFIDYVAVDGYNKAIDDVLNLIKNI